MLPILCLTLAVVLFLFTQWFYAAVILHRCIDLDEGIGLFALIIVISWTTYEVYNLNAWNTELEQMVARFCR